jgi:hypothetical protein
MLLLPIVAVFSGCTDAPTTVTPRGAAASHDLLAPPVVTVMNTDDAGAGSLRQAVIDAPDGATIQFDASIAGQTIVLTTGEIAIEKTLTIEAPVPAGMTISGNLSSRVFRVAPDGDVVFRNLSIVNGRSSSGAGVFNEGTLIIDHTLLANNEADADGGGLGITGMANQATIVNSTMSGNVARRGGGLFANRTVIIRNSTIAENTAGDGGGIVFVDGALDVRNSIIANNVDNDPTNSTTPNCAISFGEVPVLTGTNLSNDNSCGTGPAVVMANPALAPLASNGGPTKTYALLVGSPAIDGGTLCSEATDQRYVARAQGVACDIGAFELDKFATATLTIGPNVAVNTKTGVATVTGTLTCSAQGIIGIDVTLSQTQKTTGKFSTIVQASGTTSVNCAGTSSWSVALTPSTGKFENGAATGSAKTSGGFGFLPSTVTSTLKAFAAK